MATCQIKHTISAMTCMMITDVNTKKKVCHCKPIGIMQFELDPVIHVCLTSFCLLPLSSYLQKQRFKKLRVYSNPATAGGYEPKYTLIYTLYYVAYMYINIQLTRLVFRTTRHQDLFCHRLNPRKHGRQKPRGCAAKHAKQRAQMF